MAEKINQLPHPQNALNKFMVRILFERDQLVQAYNLDGKTVSIFKVKPPNRANNLDGNTVSIFKVKPPNRANNLDGNTYPDIDDINGLVDSQLEDMYHSLYGETPELPKLIDETKTECCMADANFAGVLIPPLNAMVKVHRSCIEDLRMGKGWNWEVHCEAFEELNQLSGVYTHKLNQMTANTVDKPVEIQTPAQTPTQTPAKKKNPLTKDEVKRAKWILKTKKKKYQGSLITDGTIAQFFNDPGSFSLEFRPDPTFDLLTTKQGVSKALRKYSNSLNPKPTDNQLSAVDHS